MTGKWCAWNKIGRIKNRFIMKITLHKSSFSHSFFSLVRNSYTSVWFGLLWCMKMIKQSIYFVVVEFILFFSLLPLLSPELLSSENVKLCFNVTFVTMIVSVFEITSFHFTAAYILIKWNRCNKSWYSFCWTVFWDLKWHKNASEWLFIFCALLQIWNY